MAWERLPRLRPIEYYRLGIDARGWYDSTRTAFKERLGPEADLFLGFLAATSPRANLRANVTKARKALQRYRETGIPTYDGILPAHADNLWRVVRGERLSGPKVSSFHAALTGDANAVPVDVWMARAFGFGDRPTLAQTREIQRRVRNLASHLGDEPRRVQAAIWTGFKRHVQGSNTVVANFETLYDEKESQ